MHRRAARVPECHRVRDRIVIRRVLEFRSIDSQTRRQRQVARGSPFILCVGAGVQHVERLNRLAEAGNVVIPNLEQP